MKLAIAPEKPILEDEVQKAISSGSKATIIA